MLHHIATVIHKHAEDLGGGFTGLFVYLLKYFVIGERIWEDVHDLLMAGLSAIVGYLAVVLVRKVIATGTNNKEDAKA